MPLQPVFRESRRVGPRPRTTPTNPHTQLDQNPAPEFQERLFEIGRSLPDVVVGPSGVSVPGARAFHLPTQTEASPGTFMIDREFAHLHPPADGSLHMTLPPDIIETVTQNGWGELHPLAGRYGLPPNIMMVYGPRNEDELAVVAALLRASHAFARSRPVR